MKYTLYLFLAGLLFLGSCKQFAYYQSPLHNSTSSYKTIPLKSDSIKAATYASAVFSGGGANRNQRDGIAGFIGNVYRAHNFHKVQAYYGVTGMVGNYRISKYADESQLAPYQNLNLNDSLINLHAGNTFFGSAGVMGGVNFVAPFENGGEWRIIGLEACWQHEFGDYLSFRKNLPDTAANIISRYSQYMTFAVGTEAVIKTRRGQLGFKISRLWSTHKLKGYNDEGKKMTIYPGQLSNTIQLTVNRITGYVQLNFGTYAVGTLMGVNCRIGR